MVIESFYWYFGSKIIKKNFVPLASKLLDHFKITQQMVRSGKKSSRVLVCACLLCKYDVWLWTLTIQSDPKPKGMKVDFVENKLEVPFENFF